WPELADRGGLIGYGPRIVQLYRDVMSRQFATLMRGTMPADIPVEQPTKFELVINLKTPRRSASTFRRRCSPAPARGSNRPQFAALHMSPPGTLPTCPGWCGTSTFRGNVLQNYFGRLGEQYRFKNSDCVAPLIQKTLRYDSIIADQPPFAEFCNTFRRLADLL